MPDALKQLLDEAKGLLPEIVQLRRRIHRRPEVGLTLPQTQSAVVGALKGLDLEITTGKRLSSVVAVLNGKSPGRTVLLRADMDALNLQESTGLDFASEIDGTMHACGHDSHTAMLVGAARLLSRRKDHIAGRVLFMFQPGEEGFAGARIMIEEGLLDRFGKPDAAFALHIAPNYPCGIVATRAGSLMAGQGAFTIVVKGRGGHPAQPHHALDPIPIASEIVLALRAYVTRHITESEPAVLTVTAIQAGTIEVGAIPETATLQGTIRAVSEETRQRLFNAVRELATNIATSHGAAADVRVDAGYPPVVNDPVIVQAVKEVSERLLGKERFHLLPAPIMPSEDFSYVLQCVPGAMAFLGAGPDGEVPLADVHSPKMILNEDAISVGAALHAAVAIHRLEGK